jgi:4-hydroxybenzoate polyprenyltransferase
LRPAIEKFVRRTENDDQTQSHPRLHLDQLMSAENPSISGTSGRAGLDPVPLCVDMAGALVLTDTLIESALGLARNNPFLLLAMPFWLLKGRAHLRHEITRRVRLDPALLPLNSELVRFLKEEKARNRRLILITEADEEIGRAVAQYLGIFDEVLASNGSANRLPAQKARQLEERFGRRGFDYIGNDFADLPVWAAARSSGLATNSRRRLRMAKTRANVSWVFPPPRAGIRTWARALRMHQWAKNALVFIPLTGAHRWNDLPSVAIAIQAFFSFSLCASSVYLLNDLIDLEADRHHPSKRHRPFASGQLPLMAGLIASPLLLAGAIALAIPLGWAFTALFIFYFCLTFFYSLGMKRIELLDVFMLTGLYSLRMLAGGAATKVEVSDWLLGFSTFLFLSLAFVKRFVELQGLRTAQSGGKLKGRGYHTDDLELVSSMGVSSGYLAVLIFALYVSHPDVSALYLHPRALWLACPLLLFWISRIWLLAHRRNLSEDPVLFALKDVPSWLVLLGLALVGLAATPR